MGMNTPKPLQTAGKGAIIRCVGDDDLLGAAGNDADDSAFAVDEKPDLAAGFVGKTAEVPGKFRGDQHLDRDAPAVQLFKPPDLVGFEPVRMSVYFFHAVSKGGRVKSGAGRAMRHPTGSPVHLQRQGFQNGCKHPKMPGERPPPVRFAVWQESVRPFPDWDCWGPCCRPHPGR